MARINPTDNPVATNDDPEAGDATYATKPPGFLKMRDVKDGGAPTYINDPHGDYDYGMPAFAAAMMALMRLLRHLGYPAAIWFVLVANRDVVPVLVFALLSVRQGLHILVVLLCACVNPAFLLVDVGASMRDRGDSLGGYSFLAMYVVAPEKFVALALLGEKGGLNISDGQALLCCALLDLCWVAALGAGLSAGNLSPVLAAGYGAIVLAAVWTPAANPVKVGPAICGQLLAFMVPFALGAGWIGGDDASGPLSGSSGGPTGAPESESASEEDPGFLSGVPEWLVTTCIVAAILGCCSFGLAAALLQNEKFNRSGLLGLFILMGLGSGGATCCMGGLVVLVSAGAVASGYAWVVVPVLAVLCFMVCVGEGCLAR